MPLGMPISERERHGSHRQQQRVRQAREVELEHRRAVVERLAEVALRRLAMKLQYCTQSG
jgi:hypothetical protein